MWCIDQFYILFWILLESGTAYCLSWRYLHWLDIEIVYFVFDAEKLILSKWWEHTAETLGEEFKLAESIWWGEATTLWVWIMRCIGIVRTMAIFFSSYLSESFVMRCFGIVRTIPTSSSSWPRIIHLILWCAFYRSWDDFGYLYEDDIVWSDFGLQCGSAITVVERLQRYNCIWLTYIDNVEQNILFYLEVWSCEMLSLCGKLIWRRNVVFWLCFVSRRRLYRYLV